MKANLYGEHGIKFGGAPSEPSPAETEIDLPIPEPVYPELSRALDPKLVKSAKASVLKRIKRMGEKNESSESNLADFNLMEGQCNSEELELGVDQDQDQDQSESKQ